MAERSLAEAGCLDVLLVSGDTATASDELKRRALELLTASEG
ncbi:hypothetical protein [Streptomyces lincolnensis]